MAFRCFSPNFSIAIIGLEKEVTDIKRDIAQKVKERVDRNQKEYIMREHLNVIREEMGDGDSQTEVEEFKKATEALCAPEYVKSKLQKEIRHYERLSSNTSESAVIRTYIETLLELPWNKATEDNNDIINAEKILEKEHYGLNKVK